MHAVLDTAVDGIITIDERGVVDTFNQAASRVFGYGQSEVLGHNVSMLMGDPDRNRHDHYIERYLRTGEARVIGIGRELAGRHKDGSTIPIELAVSESIVGERRIFTGIIRDLTERKRIEEAVLAEQRFAIAVVETVGALVAVLDQNGAIVKFNRACEETTGFSQEELLGQPVWNLIPEEQRDTARSVFEELRAGSFPNSNENQWLTRSSDRRLISWRNTALLGSSGDVEYVIATGIDITELRAADQATVDALEEARREIGRDLHDGLGQHLTGVTLLGKVLEQRLVDSNAPGSEEARRTPNSPQKRYRRREGSPAAYIPRN